MSLNQNKLNHLSLMHMNCIYSLSIWFAFIRIFTIEKAAIRDTSGLNAYISTAILKIFAL